MDLDTVLARIARNPRLPTPPPLALRILEKASKPDCALADISKLIRYDPGLCAKLLKIVNSAFFNLSGKIVDISRGVNLLGLKRVRALVLGLSLPSMQRRTSADSRMSDHWKMSVAMAMAAREWAVVRRTPDADSEMVAALLCDLGALILREVFPEEYNRVLDHPIEFVVQHQCALEEEFLGTNHAEVGAYLLSQWGLPDDITQAIRYHHRPTDVPDHSSPAFRRALDLHFVSLIGQLQLAPREPAVVTRLLTLAAERFHLDAHQLEKFLEPLHNNIEEFAALINVQIGTTQQYPGLLANATEQLAQIASETALENIRVHEEKDRVDRLRQQSEAELDRLARAHELILDAAGEGIFGVDRQGRITFVNPAAAAMIGWTREELIGQFHHDLLRPSAGGQTPLLWEQSFIHNVLQDGRTRHVEDGRFCRRDGSSFPVRCTCAPMHEEGVIVGAVVYYRDVSTLRHTEEALRRSEEQFRQAQKMEAIGQLAGGVAHDFNNLLTIISGYSDLLLNGILGPQDAAREAVDEIRKAAHRASALTRQLLAFSRKQVLTPQVLVLNSVVQDMDKMLRRLIGEDIQLTTSLVEDLDTVKADPGQIEQVLLNLAVNARDAMPQGGRLTIETANVVLDETYVASHPGARPGPFVMLAVTDTGCGMDAATQARIFEPFFTTKGAGKGTGLGLATVYGIVKQSGGCIYVYSEVGRGTSFKVYLPRVEDTAAAPSRLAAAPPSQVRAGGQETLLIVEDDDAVRALTRTVLRGNSYNVIEAVDGDEALRWVEQHSEPIHLLVTDVVMPGMSGRVLAERVTELRPDLKVLYVSGYTDDAVVRHGLLEADIAFLQKPFSPDALTRKVRELLDQ
jgi:PAS domain S-box-containing protein